MHHLISNADETELDPDMDEDITEYLLSIFGAGVTIATISPVMLNYIYRMFQSKNVLKMSKNKVAAKSSSNSIFNFSLAKTAVFLANVKALKKQGAELSTLKNYANLVLSTQQNVEASHIEHMSEQTDTILSAGKTELLHYVSREDNRVRKEHAEADGTILPKSDPFWNTALHLLSDFNCRCHVITESDVSKLNPKGKNYKYNDAKKTSVSEIDLKSGKAGLFKETLPAFKNADPIVRKYYRKLSDNIYE